MYENRYHSQDLSQYSFLITGGAGFIGSNFVEYLLKYNARKVRVLDNLSTGKLANIQDFFSNPSFEFINGDIRNLDDCKNAVKGVNFVSHQAALGSVPRSLEDPITSNEVNISGFLNVMVASRDANINRFVYAASSSTYGDSQELPKVEGRIGKPLSPYAVTKFVNELYAEVFAQVYNFNSIGLRYFNVFGPKQDPFGAYAAVIPLFIKSVINDKPPIINGDGEQTRDFTFIENVIQANIKAFFPKDNMEKHQVINIGAGDRTSLNALWNIICGIRQVKIKAVYGLPRPGDIRDSLANISKAQMVIDYMPKFKIKEGLSIALNWYLNNLNVLEKLNCA